MENKNTIIAVVLMIAVWFGFSILFPQHAPQKAEEQAPAVTQSSPAASAPAAVAAPASSDTGSSALQLLDKTDTAATAKTITIDTPLYRAVFTTSGGRLIDFTLKKYKETTDPSSQLVALVNKVNHAGSLLLSGTDSLGISPNVVYRTDSPDQVDVGVGDKGEIRLIAQAPSGLVVEKVLKFDGGSYAFNLEVKIVNDSKNVLQGTVGMSLIHPWDPEHPGGRYDYIGPASLVGEKVETAKIADLEKTPQVFGKNTVWTGFEDKYFMDIGVPLNGIAEKVVVEKNSFGIENRIQSNYLSLNPGQSQALGYLFYFGPRDLDILKTLDHQLSKAIDFGFFSILAKPLLHVLKFFYSYVGNYGIAIILITVIIKLIFWPLTQKSYSSMKGMQKLQPEMQKIREKYKNDKERLNREMMELYKTHRVNPLGGCLPMIVQIPVFFALYKVLLNSIELRHAHFALWLTDLSAKDPYYITPLIMGVTMFLQQKMTPSTMDPKQAKIFMLMPVVFTFLFLNFPSGLVIYWLVNNLLTILQQYFINRKPVSA